MPIWTGGTPELCWGYFYGEHSPEEWSQYIQHLRKTIVRFDPPGAILTIAHGGILPAPSERGELGTMIASGDARSVGAHALVTNSRLARGTLVAVNWLARKPFPEKVFSQPEPALRWLAETCGEAGIDPAEVWRSVSDEVPKASFWDIPTFADPGPPVGRRA